jgi:hypothetical protein
MKNLVKQDVLAAGTIRARRFEREIAGISARGPSLIHLELQSYRGPWVTPCMRENRAGRPPTSVILGAGEAVTEFDAGSRFGAAHCGYEHEGPVLPVPAGSRG